MRGPPPRKHWDYLKKVERRSRDAALGRDWYIMAFFIRQGGTGEGRRVQLLVQRYEEVMADIQRFLADNSPDTK